MMVFSSKSEIRGYFLSSKLYFPIAKRLKQVVGVGFDGHHVYWTDIFSGHETISRSLEDGSNREVRTYRSPYALIYIYFFFSQISY